ncbi:MULTISPECIES: Sec-independent protein translocase subunit TatA [Streptomyces]|uniref:Sec-independent protein translocase protein TatA n=1 Tax=Streptomyces morookaense TaxID=1970 RepID=A0A7Y7B3F9_STRMO|nr:MULTISPECIES: Sec-independent protein translocase subunit TatA [Streptomyces]MCC2276391.1 Sec-independent protein translocase subunit TatA [Streptomyces sp. ET3-23]NVK78319.1 Sec-independent protein translocase subunit TatA [Streptomyces morookaense]GHF49359.1 Sec-independent protein translocase protein TatA [Streptomyces morookaense]
MFGRLGAPEIILILVVVVLVFGSKKLPDMARSLGKSARILKSEAKAMRSEGQNNASAPADPPADAQSPRTIKAAPGDTTSRPVNEPGDRTTQH